MNVWVGVVDSVGGYEGGHLAVFVDDTKDKVLSAIWKFLTKEDSLTEIEIYGGKLNFKQFLRRLSGYDESGEVRWMVRMFRPGSHKQFFPE